MSRQAIRKFLIRFYFLVFVPMVLIVADADAFPSKRPVQWLVETALAGLGGGIVLYGFACLRDKRMIDDVPRSWIGSVAIGLAEMKGSARTAAPLVHPVTGAACALIDVGGVPSEQSFHLEDRTGRIRVDPKGAVLDLRNRAPRPSRRQDFFITPGQTVYVLGTVRRTGDSTRDPATGLRDELRRLKSDPERLAQFDANADGAIDDAEWGRAVDASRERLAIEAAARSALEPGDALVIGKGESEPTFIIADRPAAMIARGLLLRSLACFFAGSMMLGACGVALCIQYDVFSG